MAKKIFFIAGESSGDLHGAHLINSLRSLSPDLEISGLGGAQMKKAGAEIYEDLTDVAVIGFIEVFKNYKRFKNAYNLALHKIDQTKPDLVVLIDYPGFNLKIATEIKKRNIPIIYYISPQVWAWGKNRVQHIKRTIDAIIVLFNFEKELYEKSGMNVFFSGHPLVDIAKPNDYKNTIIQKHNFDASKKIISLLPGSRINEVTRILPIMLDSTKIIHNKDCNIQFLILKSPNVDEKIYSRIIDATNLPVRIIEGETYDLLSISDFALVCSGTATLETAILQVPMVIIYKIGFASWLLIKNLISIPHIGLVNIVAGKRIVPEFVQFDAKPTKIANYVLDTIHDENKTHEIKSNLESVREMLGSPGASNRAAEHIYNFLLTFKG
jgi:lipid-A-disaccharide synthase